MTNLVGLSAPVALLLTLGVVAPTLSEDGCSSPTPTEPPQAGPGLRINEVMYNPEAGPEWVEIINASDAPLSLDGLLLTDNEGLDVNEGEYYFPSGLVLQPGALYTVGASAWSGLDAVWGSQGPNLANAGDDLALVNDADGDGLFIEADVIDSMSISPALGANGDGSSLIRICLSCDGGAASSWDSSPQWGGTPGEDNDSAPFVTPAPTPEPLPGSGKRVLFDAAHCQRCGNADWVITGGYSDFADALTALGFEVSSTTARMTSTSLNGYDVLVVPEPQQSFTATEKDAMAAFLAQGKGIMMIANHIGSDRNFDGWDSVEVFNGYQQGQQTPSTDWLANLVSIRFREKQYSEDPITDVRNHPAVTGVSAAGIYSGTTVDILDASRATGLIYPANTSWGPMAVAATPAVGGRVIAVGDSSPFDDGTCGCGDDLTNNWVDWNHKELAESSVLWLAKIY